MAKEHAQRRPSLGLDPQCIFTICAHNDDQLLGAGGTIIKYAEEGIKPYTYIFSYGETSHPHLRSEVIAEQREIESYKASRILKDRITYFGLKEGNFVKEFNPMVLEELIRKKRPFRIFTHSTDDPHPDHKAVRNMVIKIVNRMKYKGDVYGFDMWNVFAFRTGNNPKLFVDISDSFDRKMEAFSMHKSQRNTMISLGWSIYFRAIIAGWQNHCKYAEIFYKIYTRKDSLKVEDGR